MKERITLQQLKELSAPQQENLRSRWIPQEGDYIALGDHEEMIYYLNGVVKSKSLPLLNIGQMLAYLEAWERPIHLRRDSDEWVVQTSKVELRTEELCDALWEALKPHL